MSKGRAPVYFMNDNTAKMRLEGSIIDMDTSTIRVCASSSSRSRRCRGHMRSIRRLYAEVPAFYLGSSDTDGARHFRSYVQARISDAWKDSRSTVRCAAFRNNHVSIVATGMPAKYTQRFNGPNGHVVSRWPMPCPSHTTETSPRCPTSSLAAKRTLTTFASLYTRARRHARSCACTEGRGSANQRSLIR